jgi:proteasome assembly chaperone (PAC2) family protein
MRTLRFIVDGQLIKPDPNCDFSGLVPGTEGYLKAEFVFSPEWTGCAKVASFYSVLGEEFAPQVLVDGKSCIIPARALKNRIFKIKVLGKRNDYVIRTNKVEVNQNGGVA